MFVLNASFVTIKAGMVLIFKEIIVWAKIKHSKKNGPCSDFVEKYSIKKCKKLQNL